MQIIRQLEEKGRSSRCEAKVKQAWCWMGHFIRAKPDAVRTLHGTTCAGKKIKNLTQASANLQEQERYPLSRRNPSQLCNLVLRASSARLSRQSWTHCGCVATRSALEPEPDCAPFSPSAASLSAAGLRSGRPRPPASRRGAPVGSGFEHGGPCSGSGRGCGADARGGGGCGFGAAGGAFARAGRSVS